MYSKFYAIYQNSRNGSWQFLIDNKINSLPVNLNAIIDGMGIKLRIDSANVLAPRERGATITDGSNTYILLKRDTVPVMRYTTAHELGHIFLGHTLKDGKIGRTFAINDTQEYEAERFAIDILAPACVLWGLNLHSAEDIAKVCNISISSAQRRAERMKELYRRNMFLSHPLERQVYKQFKSWILTTKANNGII